MNGNEISDNQVEDVSEGVHTKDFEVFNPFLNSNLLILFIFSIFSENKFLPVLSSIYTWHPHFYLVTKT